LEFFRVITRADPGVGFELVIKCLIECEAWYLGNRFIIEIELCQRIVSADWPGISEQFIGSGAEGRVTSQQDSYFMTRISNARLPQAQVIFSD
jgi:hypothetical protein